MRRGRKSRFSGLLALIVPVLLLAAVWMLARGAERLDEGRGDEARVRLEGAIRRGCTACYAAEGRYPERLEDLEERYGLQIDRERFTVRYRAFGENLMPEITVLENER